MFRKGTVPSSSVWKRNHEREEGIVNLHKHLNLRSFQDKYCKLILHKIPSFEPYIRKLQNINRTYEGIIKMNLQEIASG
jgi:phosphatidylinositol kinase/protein kinase (PI-3  family)